MDESTKNSDYVLPWDAAEADRLNFQHRLLCRIFGGLLRAPLKKEEVRRVLDLGCGTGIWMTDCAHEYPNAEIVGVDLNEWPDWSNAPSNCTFKVGNMETDEIWSELGQPFDVILCRYLTAGIKDWPALVERVSAHLAPGGWFESQEFDLPFISECGATARDSKFMEWNDYFMEGLLKSGLTPGAIGSFRPLLSKVGLINARVESFKMRLGTWSDNEEERELSEMGTQNIGSGLHGFGEKMFIGTLGWTAQQHRELVEEAKKDAFTHDHRIYLPEEVCIAQKPGAHGS